MLDLNEARDCCHGDETFETEIVRIDALLLGAHEAHEVARNLPALGARCGGESSCEGGGRPTQRVVALGEPEDCVSERGDADDGSTRCSVIPHEVVEVSTRCLLV